MHLILLNDYKGFKNDEQWMFVFIIFINRIRNTLSILRHTQNQFHSVEAEILSLLANPLLKAFQKEFIQIIVLKVLKAISHLYFLRFHLLQYFYCLVSFDNYLYSYVQ